MAENNYLALLQNGTQIAMNWADRVASNLDSAFQSSERMRQFEAQMAMKASEFNAQMAVNDVRMAEQIRMNDVQAAHLRFTDELNAKKAEAEFALMPMQMEIQQLNLEAAKLNKTRAIQADKDKIFNSITSPFDIQASSLLANTRSAEFGNGYLALKSKYQSQVAQGLPFDEQGFRTEYDELASSFQGVVPISKEYNPEVANLLERMGAPNEAARMRAENPTFAGSLQGLKAGALVRGPQAFQEMVTQYGSFLGSDEEIGQFAVQAQAYYGFGESIAMKQAEKRQFTQEFGDAKSPQEKQKILERINTLNDDIVTLDNKRKEIYNQALGIKIAGVDTPAMEEPTELRKYRQALAQKDQEKNAPEPPALFSPNQEREAKLANIGSFTVNFPQAFEGIDFRTWKGQTNIKKSPEYVKSLRNEIIKNLNTLPLDESDGDATNGTISALFQSDSFKKIFDSLKNNAVRSPSVLSDEGTSYIGDRSIVQYLTSGLGLTELSGYAEIADYNEALDLIRNFQGTAEQKRRFAERLYATVLAAGAVNQIGN